MNEEKYREASQVAFDYVVETDQHNLTDVVKKIFKMPIIRKTLLLNFAV
jgi:hypothetical protein